MCIYPPFTDITPSLLSLIFLQTNTVFFFFNGVGAVLHFWEQKNKLGKDLEGQPGSLKCGNSLLSHLIPAPSEQQHNNLLNLFDLAHMLEPTWTLFAWKPPWISLHKSTVKRITEHSTILQLLDKWLIEFPKNSFTLKIMDPLS